MKLKVVIIDLEIPPRVKRAALRVGIPLAVVVGGGAVAWAAGLHTWTAGDKLQASDLNANFTTLQNEITAVQASVHPASGFHAHMSSAGSAINGSWTWQNVVFDAVVFDAADEYSASTGVFTAKSGGTYVVTCGVEPDWSATALGVWNVGIMVNGAFDTGGSGSQTQNVRTEATDIVTLAPGGTIACALEQGTGTSYPISVQYGTRNMFAAYRVY